MPFAGRSSILTRLLAAVAAAAIATCGPARSSAEPAGARLAVQGASTTTPIRSHPLSTITPSPVPFVPGRSSPIGDALLVEPPQHVRPALSTSDCNGHLAPFGCAAVIQGGNLILLWDAPASGPADGYRIYGVDRSGNGATPIASVTNARQTIVEMPTVHAYAGHCYAVSTYAGARESVRGNVFCATADSTAKTKFLFPVEQLQSYQHREHLFEAEREGGLVVGYYYEDYKNITGDGYFNGFYRSAVEFDLAPYARHRLVIARLHLTIDTSYGMGNNYSCATTVGTGTEFWWRSDANPWIQGNFSPSGDLPVTGPQVASDVTPIVAPCLNGAPNYGLVIRNNDENLGAFTNKQCETTYVNPLLEIVYF